jgi:hypothetical protein
VYAKNETDRARIKMRHAYMLQAQLQEEQALLAKASVEKDSEKPSLMKSKKMFRISESTYHILEEAFEKEKQDRMNIKRRLNYAYNYMAKVMFKNFKRRNKDDEYEDDSSDSSSDVSSIKESNRRGSLAGRPNLTRAITRSAHLFSNFNINETKRHLEYNAVFEDEDGGGMETKDELYIANVVADFLNAVMPIGTTTHGNGSWADTWHRMLRDHDYTAMFYDASLTFPRSLRWINICLQILINLFFDTIFFGIFFPDTGVCEGFTTRTNCLQPQNDILNVPLCVWNNDAAYASGGYCRLRPPPSNFTFACILVVVCEVVAIPLAFLYDFILKENCNRRPDFDAWGINAEYYLGRSTQVNSTAEQQVTESKLRNVYNEVETARKKSMEADLASFLTSKQVICRIYFLFHLLGFLSLVFSFV